MIIHDNEVLGPEHLAELSAVFEKTWAAFRCSANTGRSNQERAQLACILLRLYGLRQLGADQLAQTALRLMQQPSPGVSIPRPQKALVGRNLRAIQGPPSPG
jgi:hypothetical protein